jgi:hypothetical protein
MKPMTLACRGLLLVALVCSHQMLLVHAAITLAAPSEAANALSTHAATGAPVKHTDADSSTVQEMVSTTVPALTANSSHAHGAASRALVSYNYRRSLTGQKIAWGLIFAGKSAEVVLEWSVADTKLSAVTLIMLYYCCDTCEPTEIMTLWQLMVHGTAASASQTLTMCRMMPQSSLPDRVTNAMSTVQIHA